MQADGRPQNQEEYTMGESSAEDQSLSPRLKNIWVGIKMPYVHNVVLVSFSKVGAPRKGWSSGSGFWGESFPEETAYACPGED